VAAAVLVAAVGAWLLARRGPATFEERLTAAAGDLAEAAPALLGELVLPLGDARAAAAEVRGGGRWVAPAGTLLEPPQEMRWTRPLGATRVRVRVQGEGFSWEREVEGESVAMPPLAPGRYVLGLQGVDSLARQEARRVIRVADAAEAQRHARALDEIRARAPADLADALVARYALRHRLLAPAAEAIERLRAAGARAASEEVARLAAHLAAAGGSSE
jgi:hypothetical protein